MRLVVSFAVLLAAVAVQADIVRWCDGSRHWRTPIKAAESGIILTMGLGDGGDAGGGQSRPATPTPDFEQMLREAYELVDDGDLPAALRALQRIVMHAPEDVLDDLDRRVRAARGSALDEYIADLRIRDALDPPRGRLFELKFATRYEAGALVRRLESLCRRLLDKEYVGVTIEVWAGRADEYVQLQPDARRMVSDARLAAAMIGARVRFDARLKTDLAERRRLVALRTDLSRFIAKVGRLPGFTSLDSDANDRDDPTLIEARRLIAEQTAARQAAIEQASTRRAEGEEAATSQPAEE